MVDNDVARTASRMVLVSRSFCSVRESRNVGVADCGFERVRGLARAVVKDFDCSLFPAHDALVTKYSCDA